MKIETITYQHRRDFNAVLICEHCGAKQELKGGYDDSYFHNNVIPRIECKECGKIASDDYKPRDTKYPDGIQV